MDSQPSLVNGTTYENRIPMQFWAEDDIPIEKLLLKGTASLSDAELLSILIGSGTPGENSLDIAQKIMASCQNNLCEFWMLLLNRANKIMKTVKISEGGISGTVVDPKKIFCIALENHASSIIISHCHPSGACAPSEADIKITKKIKDAGVLLEISVLDHIIVAHDSYYSFADEGTL